ncbi:hypothetical protein [Phormidium sp. FACHB-1136]|jgi:hypothetical protein|uniref:hypothetical protein n=1 Tax=Phormidium sp. FACHB-1136 TaxID=2692848 RepID=UPI001682848B|nr:hypothetical protein [Phormidium sp. FACHB-1136]MBD2428686.1 hypothetical protein [Phormidium sp. FACHB-1136]
MVMLPFKSLAALAFSAVALASGAALVQAQSRTDSLSTGQSVSYDGFLYAGETVYATCDSDCTDLDILLYDANDGSLVASDVFPDAQPVVTAPYEGSFVIEVVMASCSVEPCATWTDSDNGF